MIGPVILGAGRHQGYGLCKPLGRSKSMTRLSSAQFSDFFQELHGRPPYSWQTRLAERGSRGIGLERLTCLPAAARRLASTLPSSPGVSGRPKGRGTNGAPANSLLRESPGDRRRSVSAGATHREAALGSRAIPCFRRPGPLRSRRLARQTAGMANDDGTPPLDVLELRGGIYHDNRWARSGRNPPWSAPRSISSARGCFLRLWRLAQCRPYSGRLVAYDSLVLLDKGTSASRSSRPWRTSAATLTRRPGPRSRLALAL